MSQHALYRFYDHAGELLYIGITRDPASRWARHSEDKQWWHEVQRIAIQTMPDRDSALKAERAAIKAEKPRYNLAHNRPGPATPPPSGDEKAARVRFRWQLAAAEWKSATGNELPRCECCLPDGQSCGDIGCVAAMAAHAEGAIRGMEEAARLIGLKSGYRESFKEVP